MLNLSRTLSRTRDQLPGDLVATVITAPPTVEPITRDEAKAYLRVERDDENTLFDSWIQAARERIESRYGVAMIEQTIEATFLGAATYLALPRAPAQQITSAQVLNGGEISSTLLLTRGKSPILSRADRDAFLSAGEQITVTYVAGSIIGDTLTDAERRAAVPAVLKQAIRLTVADQWEHRGTLNVGQGYSVIRLPENVQTLLTEAGYRRYEV